MECDRWGAVEGRGAAVQYCCRILLLVRRIPLTTVSGPIEANSSLTAPRPKAVGRRSQSGGVRSRQRMSEQLHLLNLVTGRLNAANIAYMVTGSMAVSYYAQPRFTRDIDLVVEIEPEAAGGVAALFERDFYVDADALRAALQREGMVNLIHNASLIKIDLIARKNDEYHREEFRRRRRVDVGGELSMVAPEDLILSKLLWLKQGGSDVHRRDAVSVLTAGAQIDRAYIDRWAPQLSVSALWQEIGA